MHMHRGFALCKNAGKEVYMGKTDYYTIVAKILVYLYKKYKHMELDGDYISPLTKHFPILSEQLDETVVMMESQGLLTGKITKAWGGDIAIVDYYSLKITPAGIDYLQDNSKIRKICETLKEAAMIWELFS